jgi:hypothetical protein
MGEIARGADGHRLFTPEFKKQQIGRLCHTPESRIVSGLTRSAWS